MARIIVTVEGRRGKVLHEDLVEIDDERFTAFVQELEGWNSANFMAWALEKLVYHGVKGFNADELRKMLEESKAEIHGKGV
jgi:ribosomal protein L12E/L44/L45/RPP1/RPP2